MSQFVKIHNHGMDCYIRAKITLDSIDGFAEILNKSVQIELDKGWVKAADGYYYYKNIFANAECLNLLVECQVSTDLPQELEGSQFHVNVEINALQDNRIIPDYTAHKPWGNAVRTGDVSHLQCLKWFISSCMSVSMVCLVCYRYMKRGKNDETHFESTD